MDESRWAYRAASWGSLRWKSEGAVNKNWNKYEQGYMWKLRGVGPSNKYTWDRRMHSWSDTNGCNLWMLAKDRDEWHQHEWEFTRMNLPPKKPEISSSQDKDAAQEIAFSTSNPFHLYRNFEAG